jgi:hypothetical protein
MAEEMVSIDDLTLMPEGILVRGTSEDPHLHLEDTDQ